MWPFPHNLVRAALAMAPVFSAVAAATAQDDDHVSGNGRVVPSKIRVAVYNDQGSLQAAAYIDKCLTVDHRRLKARRVSSEEIRDGILSHYDVVVLGGGNSFKQAHTLGTEGRDEICKFVGNGGGYLGICAGAYLATDDYRWSLGILKAHVFDKKHSARGGGPVRLQVTAAGARLLGLSEPYLLCQYHQGPLLVPHDDDKRAEDGKPAYTPLMVFDSEVAEKGAPHGAMIGATAMASANYGRGRVFVSSPHPESTDGLDGVIRSAVRWLARQER